LIRFYLCVVLKSFSLSRSLSGLNKVCVCSVAVAPFSSSSSSEEEKETCSCRARVSI
jgi:hypothetical protein